MSSDLSKSSQLQVKLQVQLEQLRSERLGKIVVSHGVAIESEGVFSLPSFTSGNLCETIQQYQKIPIARIYIEPPTNREGIVPNDLSEQVHFLKERMKMASMAGGDVIVQAGTGKKVQSGFKRVAVFRCQCGMHYKGKKISDSGTPLLSLNYRQESFVNDRANNRHGTDGRKGPKRSRALRHTPLNGTICGFNFSLLHDGVGFFVKPQNGSPFHRGHPTRPFLRTPSRFLHPSDLEAIGDVAQTNAPAGVAVQLHQTRTARFGSGTVLSQDQIRYRCKKLAKSLPTAGVLPDADENSPGSEMDSLFQYLQKSGSKYICLTEQIKTDIENGENRRQSLLVNESIQESAVCHSIENNLQGQELQDATKDALASRTIRGLTDEQDMVVGIAFTTPFEAKQFTLFPYVIHVDATADTNKNTFPLVTIAGKDSFGKMFIILRAFLPSEKSWAYRWLFQTVLPHLLDADALSRIKAAVSDGDSQEIQQLCSAIMRFFPQAIRIRCGWHIVDRGWERVVKFALGGFSKRKRPTHLSGKRRRKAPALTMANRCARCIYRWIYSWCRPKYCLSREEFLISYALFINFINSDVVAELLGVDACETISKFVRENVLPHQDNFCYYTRHSVFHLEANSNCGLEGIQNGTKHSSNPVRPSTTLEKAVRVLERNSTIKAIDRSISVCERANSTKLWSYTSTSAVVTEVAESMISHEWSSRNNYKCILAGHGTWYVTHKENNWYPEDDEDDDEDSEEDNSSNKSNDKHAFCGIIPKFARNYHVKITEERVMTCACKNQERMGFPCAHIACVLASYDCFAQLCDKGFPVSSVSIMWHSGYYSYGISNDPAHQAVQETYRAMQENDTAGVLLPNNIVLPSPDRILPREEINFVKPAVERVRNYPLEHVRRSVDKVVNNPDYPQFSSIIPAGMTQQSNINNQDYSSQSDDEHFTLQDDGDYERRLLENPEDAHVFDDAHSFAKFKAKFRDACKYMDCVDNQVHLHQRMDEFLDSIIHDSIYQAKMERGCELCPKGKKVAMLPPISKKQKTHGTQHY